MHISLSYKLNTDGLLGFTVQVTLYSGTGSLLQVFEAVNNIELRQPIAAAFSQSGESLLLSSNGYLTIYGVGADKRWARIHTMQVGLDMMKDAQMDMYKCQVVLSTSLG